MKFEVDSTAVKPEISEQSTIQLPDGLVGFPELKEMELVRSEEEAPFMWLRENDPEGLAFLVVNPFELVPDYSIQILTPDVDALGAKSADELMILTIVTIRNAGKQTVTANLVGPVVINLTTLTARQVVIGNFKHYSAYHVLFEEEQVESAVEV